MVLSLWFGCALVSGDDFAQRLDLDGDGLARPTDCDDQDFGVGAAIEWYADVDADGFGAGEGTYGCEARVGFADRGDDCDDTDPTIGARYWHPDADEDGYGDAAVVQSACTQPDGSLENGTDCDDADADVSPAATEAVGDGIDHNCDGHDGLETPFGSEMIAVPAGSFVMGGGNGDASGAYRDHHVALTHAFWLGKQELSARDWAAWTEAPDSSPSYHTRCKECPVEQVTWFDAALYANAASEADGLQRCYLRDGSGLAAAFTADPYACPGYRLPTEAEWEYASDAGTGLSYAGSDVADEVAWTLENASQASHEACMLAANAHGFCDLSGNVFEWTNDWGDTAYGGYGDGYAQTDPTGPTTGTYRVLRGGDWSLNELHATVPGRTGAGPDGSARTIGFRLARTL